MKTLKVGSHAAILAISVTGLAEAASAWRADRTVYDAENSNVVRCFSDEGAKKSVFFDWSRKDFFKRKITYRVSPISGCRGAKVLALVGREMSDEEIASGTLDERVLPKSIAVSLRYVQRGASVVDAANADRDFLPLGPGEEYTQDLNRSLTARYGAEFSTKTFENWLNAEPKNAELRARLRDDLRTAVANELAGRKTAPFADAPPKIVFMASLGLGWSDDVADQTRPDVEKWVTTLISEAGYPVEFMHRDPYAPLEVGGRQMSEAIYRRLENGENVALVGLSQGTPEVLIAEAIAARRVKESGHSERFGKILGVVSFSGISNGTYLAAVPNKIPNAAGVTDFLTKLPFAKLSGLTRLLHTVAGLGEVPVKATVAKYTADLPADAVYLDLCGITSDFGLPGAGALKEITDVLKLVRKFNWADAANDGFADYPTLMPARLSPAQYAIAIHGTHYIFDGEFEGIDLREKAARNVLLKVVFNTFLRLYDENYRIEKDRP